MIGKNGTGKTTLLKLLSGLEKSDENQILNLYPNVYSPIGIHLESAKLYPFLTGKQNIQFFTSDIYNSHYSPEFLIKEFELEKLINKKVKFYSLGTKQKISLIIAILMAEKLLLLDEPTNGLDDNSINTLKEILIHLSKKQQVTIIIATHELIELKDLFDEILMINNCSLERIDKVVNLE